MRGSLRECRLKQRQLSKCPKNGPFVSLREPPSTVVPLRYLAQGEALRIICYQKGCFLRTKTIFRLPCARGAVSVADWRVVPFIIHPFLTFTIGYDNALICHHCPCITLVVAGYNKYIIFYRMSSFFLHKPRVYKFTSRHFFACIVEQFFPNLLQTICFPCIISIHWQAKQRRFKIRRVR